MNLWQDGSDRDRARLWNPEHVECATLMSPRSAYSIRARGRTASPKAGCMAAITTCSPSWIGCLAKRGRPCMGSGRVIERVRTAVPDGVFTFPRRISRSLSPRTNCVTRCRQPHRSSLKEAKCWTSLKPPASTYRRPWKGQMFPRTRRSGSTYKRMSSCPWWTLHVPIEDRSYSSCSSVGDGGSLAQVEATVFKE